MFSSKISNSARMHASIILKVGVSAIKGKIIEDIQI